MKLLSQYNTKFDKSSKAFSNFQIFGLSLAPEKKSGYQVCPNASKGCINSCIFSSGYANIFPAVKLARIKKTKLWFENREIFKKELLSELKSINNWSRTHNKKIAIRLNVFSDITWEKQFGELFELFNSFQFYDYTKNFNRMKAFLKGQLPSNYHLTFSRSENNDADCDKILRLGGNVAIVFEKELPIKWGDYKVIDGDKHDLRFLDKSPCIVGLKAKAYGKEDNTGFVVRTQ